MRIATLLSIMGDEAAKVYDTWEESANETIDDILSKFDNYCEPCTGNRHMQSRRPDNSTVTSDAKRCTRHG